jgi:hypothetical protein
MPTRPIRITGSNSSNHSLILNDHGHTTADAGDTILWQIDAHSGVYSIISIQEKSGSTNIFSSPPRPQGNNWRGDILAVVAPCTVYVYSITWLAKDGSGSHVFDPIISIRPTRFTDKILNTVLYFAAAVITIITLGLLSKRIRSK